MLLHMCLQSNSSAGPKMSFDCLVAAAAVEVSGSSGVMSSQGACSSSGSCLGSISSVTASACAPYVMCPEPLASCTHPRHIKTSKCLQVGQAHCRGPMSSDAGIHAWDKVSPGRANPHNTGYFSSACLTAVHRDINRHAGRTGSTHIVHFLIAALAACAKCLPWDSSSAGNIKARL